MLKQITETKDQMEADFFKITDKLIFKMIKDGYTWNEIIELYSWVGVK